jgi:hypothetical protein
MSAPKMTEPARERHLAEVQRAAEKVEGTVEGRRAAALGGASAHAYVCGLDVGEKYVITGHDNFGKRMRREAGSIFAVSAIMSAAYGYKRAWYIDSEGKRTRVFSR